MREYVAIMVVFALLLFGTPILFGKMSAVSGVNAYADAPDRIALYIGDTGEYISLTPEDYITGCLFAQISVNYRPEALKAQAAAANTYALRLLADGVKLSDSPATCQPYFTEKKAREIYGGEYDLYFAKVREAAEYGANRIILYRGEPIYSVYHSVSAGVTNTAYSVWGKNFPYLQSVDSGWDRNFADFDCVNEMTPEAVRMTLLNYDKSAAMPIDYTLWFTEQTKNKEGYTVSVKAGDYVFSGGDMWRVFNLRSTAFDITYDGMAFAFETKGYGHGVGLSQYGADYLAGQGHTAEEILNYYYKGISIVNI